MTRSRVPDLSRRCRRCLFPPACCLCAEVPRLETRTRIVLLRHASEIPRPSSTARWAALALPNSETLDYGVAGRALDGASLGDEGAWVLFPAPAPTPAPARPPRHLVVPDGTWAQARRMTQRVPALRTLPRLSLPLAPSRARLRRPTVAGGMSTLEAVAAALRLLGEEEAARGLEALHALALERAVRLRGRPTAEEAA